MDPARYQRLKELFLIAHSKSREEQVDFLRESCDGDPDLHAKLEALLLTDEDDQEFLANPALGPGFAVRAPDSMRGVNDHSASLPSTIAGFRIIRELGRGGMGIVFLAEQSQPRRLVALKLLHSADPSLSAIQRFQAEAASLGRLQHPGIASVIEAGAARLDSGVRPYLAMEFIEGQQLDEYLAEHAPSMNERLQLSSSIADALSHAHERGVLHGDLRSANVLVDAEGRAKLIDFGLAGSVERDKPDSIDRAEYPHTEPGARLNRQADDVFKLGLLTWKILTGGPAPSSSVELGRANLSSGVRRLLDGALANRHGYETDAAQLSAKEVCSKLLEYSAQKRRRRTLAPLLGVGAIALLLFAFALSKVGAVEQLTQQVQESSQEEELTKRVTTYLMEVLLQAQEASDSTDREIPAAADLARANIEQAFADDPDFQVAALCTLAWLDRHAGRNSGAEDAAGRAVELARSTFGPDSHATRSAMFQHGLALLELGRDDEAQELFTITLESRMERGTEFADEVNFAQQTSPLLSAWSQFHSQSGLYREALYSGTGAHSSGVLADLFSLFKILPADRSSLRLLAYQSAQLLFGPAHPETLEAACLLAAEQIRAGQVEESRELLKSTHASAVEKYGPSSAIELLCAEQLAALTFHEKRYTSSIDYTEHVYHGRWSRLGERHPRTLASLANLAYLLELANRTEESRIAWERLNELVDEFPDEQMHRAYFAALEGECQWRQFQSGAGLLSFRDALSSLSNIGPSSESPMQEGWRRAARFGVALCLLDLDDPLQALKELDQIAAELEEDFAISQSLQAVHHKRGLALVELGRLAEAVEVFRSVHDARQALLPRGDLRTVLLRNLLAKSLTELESFEEAEQAYRLSLSEIDVIQRHEPSLAARVWMKFSKFLLDRKRYDEAEDQARLAVNLVESIRPGSEKNRPYLQTLADVIAQRDR